MQAITTNLSAQTLDGFVISYITMAGSPATDTFDLPAADPSSHIGTVVMTSQPASAVTSVTITIGALTLTIPYGEIVPTPLPPTWNVKVRWSSAGGTSVVSVLDEVFNGGGPHHGAY